MPIMRKRTRSNSLPDTRPCSMQVQSVSRFEGLDPELDGINTELESLLNGINQSLHEMQENLRRGEPKKGKKMITDDVSCNPDVI